MYTYTTQGTCSRSIAIDVKDGVVKSVVFDGGCTGNAQGVSRLIVGMDVEEAIKRLEGIECRNGTSCPDQLSRALKKMTAK